MVKEIILASKSSVRRKILRENNIKCIIEPSNVDEDSVKDIWISGYYMITAIHHQITKLRHNMICEIAKDSYLKELVAEEASPAPAAPPPTTNPPSSPASPTTTPKATPVPTKPTK